MSTTHNDNLSYLDSPGLRSSIESSLNLARHTLEAERKITQALAGSLAARIDNLAGALLDVSGDQTEIGFVPGLEFREQHGDTRQYAASRFRTCEFVSQRFHETLP